MKYSNHIEVDVGFQLWSVILESSQCRTCVLFYRVQASLFPEPLGLEYGYHPDQIEQNVGIVQTNETEMWERTKLCVLARTNNQIFPLARRKARPK